MMPHDRWLASARRDLKSARLLLDGDSELTDTAIYHTQQCAEKSIKAFLIYHKHEVPRTHDLRFLIDESSKIDPAMMELLDNALLLNPYSTIFRYPESGEIIPLFEEVNIAIESSGKILERISAIIQPGLFT